MLTLADISSRGQSASGLEPSKTLRVDVGRRTSRQRLGLRSSSTAFPSPSQTVPRLTETAIGRAVRMENFKPDAEAGQRVAATPRRSQVLATPSSPVAAGWRLRTKKCDAGVATTPRRRGVAATFLGSFRASQKMSQNSAHATENSGKPISPAAICVAFVFIIHRSGFAFLVFSRGNSDF